jgi:hypothetical protein
MSSIAVAKAVRRGVLDRGVLIGDEHARGRYTVYAVFSGQPLNRAGIRSLIEDPARRDSAVLILKRPLKIR